MPTERVQVLVQRFFENTCTASEMEELAAWIDASGNDEPLKELLQDAWQRHEALISMPENMSQRLQTAMFREERKPALLTTLRWAAAVAAILLLLVGGWWLLQDEKPVQHKLAAVTKIQPGSNGAILTLSDGRMIVLDSLRNGVVTTQGGTAVKIENSQLVYNAAGAGGPVMYNTMTTPNGRQFRVILPDGTQVWLNAASSITYPTAFTGIDRKVSIKGEAYFEVAKNTAPFTVQVKDAVVQVLGTHFNINGYDDEAGLKTTLLEGKVKIGGTILQPGDQATIIEKNRVSVNHSPDLEEVMAWKNGIFYFRNANIEQVMKELERWYDIDVQYKGKIPEFKINGKMDRSLNLEEIFEFLAKMEVKYTLTGRTITIKGA